MLGELQQEMSRGWIPPWRWASDNYSEAGTPWRRRAAYAVGVRFRLHGLFSRGRRPSLERQAAGRTAFEHLGMMPDDVVRALEDLAYRVHRDRGAKEPSEAVEITSGTLFDALGEYRPRTGRIGARRLSQLARSGAREGSGALPGGLPARSGQRRPTPFPVRRRANS